MKNLTDIYNVFDSEIKKEFVAFEAEGFSFGAYKIKSTAAIGNYVEMPLTNLKKKRRLIFSYIPSHNSQPDSICIILENCIGDSFSLDEYLLHVKAPSETRESLVLGKYSGPLQERVSKCIAAHKKVIDQYLWPLILGNEWQHVPIDWGDYK